MMEEFASSSLRGPVYWTTWLNLYLNGLQFDQFGHDLARSLLVASASLLVTSVTSALLVVTS